MSDLGFFTKSFTDPEIQVLEDNTLQGSQVQLAIKREDVIDSIVSGNKFRKLKYNIAEAHKQKKKKLLTFGGAFSNHIAAVAKAGEICGFKTIGVIRGEELGENLQRTLQQNSTLKFAYDCGMQFHFVTRSSYRDKHTLCFRESLKSEFGDFYEIPEGGTNTLAVTGCTEILNADTSKFDIIACAVGTGGTIAGIIEASLPHQKVLGFPALKGDFLYEEIKKYTLKTNWDLVTDYHFGGYAKIDAVLVNFINSFKKSHGIQLDPVYTGKMMYGLTELIRDGFFSENTRILAIHTGGLQGIAGMNEKLKSKGQSLIV